MHTFAYYLCGNAVEAMNMTRTVCRQFLSKYDRLEDPTELQPLLFQQFLRNFRSQKAHHPDSDPRPSVPEERNLFSQSLKMKNPWENPDAQRVFKDEFLNLPLDLRVPLLLADYFKLTRQQIASIVALPVTTVSFRISQARGYLINAIAGHPAITAH